MELGSTFPLQRFLNMKTPGHGSAWTPAARPSRCADLAGWGTGLERMAAAWR